MIDIDETMVATEDKPSRDILINQNPAVAELAFQRSVLLSDSCSIRGSNDGGCTVIRGAPVDYTPATTAAPSSLHHPCFPSFTCAAIPDSPTDSHQSSMDLPEAFTEQEDEFLRELVKRHGTKKWHIIAAKMQGKTPRECRKRWRSYLHMCMNKSIWSEEEDHFLIEGHNTFGNRWTEIAKMVPGRTDNAVKNRYNALCKKRSHRSGKSTSITPMTAQDFMEGSEQYFKDLTRRGKKPKYRDDGMELLIPSQSRSSSVKHNLSIEIPEDGDLSRVEENRKSLSSLSNSNPSIYQEGQHSTTVDGESPKDGQVDMEEVMGWLLARTPTPTCNGSGNSNSTVTSSTSTSPSRRGDNTSYSDQAHLASFWQDTYSQQSFIPSKASRSGLVSIPGFWHQEFNSMAACCSGESSSA